MPIDNLSKITSRSGINTTILLEAGNANVTGIVTAAGFDGPFTGGSGSDINAGIVTAANGLHVGAGGTIIHALSEDRGKVGIGNTNPYYNLHINFNNSTTAFSGGTSGNWGGAGIRIENDSTTVGAMALAHFRVYDADWHIGNKYVGHNDSDFVFNHEGSEKVRIDSDGQVGIGTNNPGAPLHIHDDSPKIVLKDTDNDAEIYLHNVGGAAVYSSIGDAVFQTPSTEIIRLAATGRVGIGSDAPPTGILLDVQGHAGSGAQHTIRSKSTATNASNFVRAESSDNLYIGLLKYGTSHADYGALEAGGGAVYANSSVPITIMSDGGSGYINFATGGNTERVRIKSDGSVGIGSTDPRANFKLDVNGDLSLGESGGTDNTYIEQKQNGDLHLINSGRDSSGAAVNPTGGAGGIGINRYNTIGGDTTYFRDFTVYNGKSTKVLMVDGSESRVGIGTDAPDGKLDVRGTIFVNGDGTGGRIFASGGNLSLTDGNGRQTLRIEDPGSGNTHTHVFNSDGRLGIGTDAPATQLHLYGASNIIRLTDTDTSGPIHTNIDGASGYLTLDVGSIHRDVVITSVAQANEIARFTGDGLVGIGTATPPDWCRFSIDHGQNGLTRFSNHSHLLLQNKNAGTTDFWSLAPRDNGSITLARGTTDSNGTVASAGNSRFGISSAGRVGVGSDPTAVSSFFEANYTSGTVAYPFETENNSIQSYSPYDHEVTIKNNTVGTEDNFCGIFFKPGAHSDGNRISCARISAIDVGDYRADLVFGTRGYRGGNIRFQEVLRLDHDGHASLKTGNLAFANGAGIDFSNVPDGSRSIDTDGNKLDDYEEGSFTPAYSTQSAAMTASYVNQDGKYTKIGRFVHFQIYLRLSSKSGGSGHLRIDNLPFASSSASGAAYGGGVVAYTNNWDNDTIDRIMVGSGSDQVQLFVGQSSGTNVNAGAGNLNNDTQLRIFGSYQV